MLVLVPAQARGANFQRVLQYVTSDLFSSDYDALEISVERRSANRWAGRASYTMSRAHDVNASTTGGSGQINKRVNDDLNPRKDYGLTNFNNTHTFATGGNWQAWRGLGISATFRFYSGADRTTNCRPATSRRAARNAGPTSRPVAGRERSRRGAGR